MRKLFRGSSGEVKLTRSFGKLGYTIPGRVEIIVMWKELVESIRDRRTMINVFLLPAILMPITMAVPLFMMSPKTSPPSVIIVNLDPMAQDLVKNLTKTLTKSTVENKEVNVSEVMARGIADLVVLIPKDFSERISAGKSATITYYFDPYNMKYSMAVSVISNVVNSYSRSILYKRLKQINMSLEYVEPVRTEMREVVPKGVSVSPAGVFSAMLLPMFVGIIAISGASSFALDMIAGERERKTLEALLSNPIGDFSVLMGKYLAMAMIAFLSALTMIISLGISLILMVTFIPFYTSESISFSLKDMFPGISYNPIAVVAGIITAVILSALTGNALITIGASFAKSFKEAQQYVGFITMALIIPIIAVPYMSPSMMGALRFVPVVNLIVFSRDIMLNPSDFLPIIESLLLSVAYLILFVWISSKMFSRETISPS
ncbi:MAG: ABC transporter permease [Candidatus Methanodesulfokora sp.]